MKNLTLAGGLTRDAVLRTTPAGDNVLGFSVAVDHRENREKTTMYFDVSMWGARGAALAQYLTKGTRVAVSGDLSTREHNGKTYLTVRADQVTLLGGGTTAGGERADGGTTRGGYDQSPLHGELDEYGSRPIPGTRRDGMDRKPLSGSFDDDIPF